MLRAIQSFFITSGRRVRKGDLVHEGDPIVKGREQFFEPEERVEQATAAPGEKRAVRRPSSKE